MSVEPPGGDGFGRLVAAATAAGGAAIGAMAASWPGAGAGLVAGLLGGLGVLRWRRGRAERRGAILALPFPQAWRTFLLERCDHYARLPPPLRTRFEDELRVFLSEKRISGIGVAADDELRLLVAASAITLSVGWPGYGWDQLSEVLLYPDDFDRDYSFGGSDRSGEAHPWGTLILSAPSLRESFDYPDEAYHVGVHEFAHLLDVDQTHFDGIPVGLDEARSREWVAIAEREMERLRSGRSLFDDYGAHDPVEFLGVAVEAFFQVPQAVRRRHRDVYAILCAYFRQDPAAWDDERGLRA